MKNVFSLLFFLKVLLRPMQSSGTCFLNSTMLTRHDQFGTIRFPPGGIIPKGRQTCTWTFDVQNHEALLLQVRSIRLPYWRRRWCKDYLVLPNGLIRCGTQTDQRSICYKHISTPCYNNKCGYIRNWMRKPVFSFVSQDESGRYSRFVVTYSILSCRKDIIRLYNPFPNLFTTIQPNEEETTQEYLINEESHLGAIWTLPVTTFLVIGLIVTACCIHSKRKPRMKKKSSISTISFHINGTQCTASMYGRKLSNTSQIVFFKPASISNEDSTPRQDFVMMGETVELNSNNRIHTHGINHQSVGQEKPCNDVQTEPEYESIHGLANQTIQHQISTKSNDYEELDDISDLENQNTGNAQIASDYEEPIQMAQPTYFTLTD